MNILPVIAQSTYFAHGITECVEKYNRLKPLGKATVTNVGGVITVSKQKYDEDTGVATSVNLFALTLPELRDAKKIFKDLADLMDVFITEAQAL